MEQARESSDEWRFDQPPVGGHRGDGQARDGVDPVPLLSLVGWVCSSRAQKEGKKAAATLSVSFLDTPFSTALKSWLVVAAARRRDSNWLGTSAGSISKRPAPSGGPGSACCPTERR